MQATYLYKPILRQIKFRKQAEVKKKSTGTLELDIIRK